MALRSDGSLYTWGWNGSGQLGDGTTTNRLSPVRVVGPGGVGFLNLGVGAGDGSPSVPVTPVQRDAGAIVVERGTRLFRFWPTAGFEPTAASGRMFEAFEVPGRVERSGSQVQFVPG